VSRRSELRRQVSRFDQAVDAGFDHLRGRPVVDRVLYTATELGDFSLIWLILGTLRGLRSERDWHAALRLGLSLGAESMLVNGLIKSVFRRRRPITEMVHPHHFRRPLTTSFPSGHATSAFSAAVLLSEDDVLWPLYVAVAVIVASSRVHVKIHHASDVVGGAAIGVALGLLIRKVAPLPPAKTLIPTVPLPVTPVRPAEPD
jgi:undecaprenyl-diphosphatase